MFLDGCDDFVEMGADRMHSNQDDTGCPGATSDRELAEVVVRGQHHGVGFNGPSEDLGVVDAPRLLEDRTQLDALNLPEAAEERSRDVLCRPAAVGSRDGLVDPLVLYCLSGELQRCLDRLRAQARVVLGQLLRRGARG